MSFHSAPHGAGRRYSRTKARALFGMDDLSLAMAGACMNVKGDCSRCDALCRLVADRERCLAYRLPRLVRAAHCDQLIV